MDASQEIAWKRIGVEGLAIIVSILIAFAIDAAWDARQDRARLQEHRHGLLEDARSNLQRIDRNVDRLELIIENSARLVDVLIERAEPAADEDLLLMLGSSMLTTGILLDTKSYDQLVASGDLGLFESAERDALASWQQRLERMRFWQAYVQEHRQLNTTPHGIETGWRAPALERLEVELIRPEYESVLQFDVLSLRGDRRHDGLLVMRHIFRLDELRMLGFLRDATEALIDVLEKRA